MQKPNMLSTEFHSLGLSEVYLCSKSLTLLSGWQDILVNTFKFKKFLERRNV